MRGQHNQLSSLQGNDQCSWEAPKEVGKIHTQSCMNQKHWCQGAACLMGAGNSNLNRTRRREIQKVMVLGVARFELL